MQSNIYLAKSLYEINRIISLIDRSIASTTYGCFDRRYWSWRIGDIPNASLQYGILPLTLVRATKFEGNNYYQNKVIKEWILAGLKYWIKIQNRNGSLNQFFPNEQSVGTTYYILSAVLQVYDLLENEIDDEIKEKIEIAVKKSAEFVLKYDETYAIISNHIALFAFVLYRLALRYNDTRYRVKADRYLNIILKHQSAEGWYLEYNGADPGYQTQCIYYLAECYRLTKNEEIVDSVKKSIEKFLVYFFHPDGSFGGEYGSRNTELIYPAGFEILKDKLESCSIISSFINQYLRKGTLISLDSMDDENLLRLTANYIITYNYSKSTDNSYEPELNLPAYNDSLQVYFPEAGILVKATDCYYMIIGASKGGVCKIFDKRNQKIIFDDPGYAFECTDSIMITNQFMQKPRLRIENQSVTLEADFYTVLNSMLMPFTNVILRLLSLTFFRSIFFVDMFKKYLVKKAFTGSRKVYLSLKREIYFRNKEIIIEDTLNKDNTCIITKQISGRKLFSVKMASSSYVSVNDMVDCCGLTINIEVLNRDNAIRVNRTIRI
ncbi:MAG: hypothetical protein AB1765_00790 [Candidatus Hydrogenedentota bacterium]